MVYINDSWSGLIILIISYSYIVVAIKDIHTRYDTSTVCIPLPRGPSGNHSSRGYLTRCPGVVSGFWKTDHADIAPVDIYDQYQLASICGNFNYAYVYVAYDTWSFYWLDNVTSHSNLDHCII